jgi:hypothetical protein
MTLVYLSAYISKLHLLWAYACHVANNRKPVRQRNIAFAKMSLARWNGLSLEAGLIAIDELCCH